MVGVVGLRSWGALGGGAAVGRRSATETTGAIFVAFLDERTWRQADLARRVGISTKALRSHLEGLARAGVPLERDEDDGVFWSVPRGWFPEAVALPRASVHELLRLLKRSPRSPTRDKLLAKILGASSAEALGGRADTVASGQLSFDEHHLDAVQDAADQRVALELSYFSASRGALSARHVSVQRVHPGAKTRFVAWCHRSGCLKWFRVDNIVWARLDAGQPYREVEPELVATFERGSAGGFYQGETPRELRFFVAAPEARWVERNLLDGMKAEQVEGGIRVGIVTASPIAVARYVVGLGGLARPETAELRQLVAELARAALAVAEGGEGGAR